MKMFINFCFLFISLCVLGNAHAQNIVGYLGHVVFFTDDPALRQNSTQNYPQGVLYIENGHVLDVGNYNQLKKKYATAKIVNYGNKFIVPGFVDVHVHYPQTEMIASYGKQLLDWLNQYTFPTEKKFSDPSHAKKIANFFLNQLLDNGTTTALVFATVSPVSVNTLFQAAQEHNMRIITGKVLMDRNAPKYLLDTPDTAYSDSKKLIEKWDGVGRLRYAVTPRFAPTSTPEELAVAGKLLKEFPHVLMQTHLAENKQEVAWVKKLFPKARSYLDVYNQYGLLTNHSVFAHSIYINAQDEQLMQEKGASIAFCPTSNLFLGSGLFNLYEVQKHKVTAGFGTDIGAGTSFSILQTMNEAYKVTQLRKAFSQNPSTQPSLNPLEALYMATLGGAKAVSEDAHIGSFQKGKEADFIVLNPNTTAPLKLRFKHAQTLPNQLFALEILGDNRTVEQTYIMGKAMKTPVSTP